MRAARILLVEDEAVIRLMIAELLQDNGFDVVEAASGDEAVRLLDEEDGFDALMTDVRMPGTLDGVDVAEHARRKHPAIPVLIASGYSEHVQARLAALRPKAVFFNKPYSMDAVVEMLKILIRPA